MCSSDLYGWHWQNGDWRYEYGYYEWVYPSVEFIERPYRYWDYSWNEYGKYWGWYNGNYQTYWGWGAYGWHWQNGDWRYEYGYYEWVYPSLEFECTDSDSDGICDYDDECPYDANTEVSCDGECGSEAYLDGCGVCVGGASGVDTPNLDTDNCGVCFGDSSTCGDPVYLELEMGYDGINVYFVPSADYDAFTAFQFSTTGGVVSDVAYDSIEDYGFEVSAGSSIVAGFSLTGSYFTCSDDDGCLILTLTVDGDDDADAEFCILDDDQTLIVSDSTATVIPSHAGECVAFCSGTGDVNQDGTLDVLDLVLIIGEIIDPSGMDNGDCEYQLMDANDDTVVNVLDVVIFVGYIID